MAYRGATGNLDAIEVPEADAARQTPLLRPVESAGGDAPSRAADAPAPSVQPATDSKAASPPSDPVADAADRLARAQALIAGKEFAAAADVLDPAVLAPEVPLDTQITWAEWLAAAHAPAQSDALFETLLEKHPRSPRVPFAYGKRLFARGEVLRAAKVMEPIAATYAAGTHPHAYIAQVMRLRDILVTEERDPIAPDTDCRLLAMKHAIARFHSRTPRAIAPDAIGRLCLVTGSLGPGGAERQLSRVAAELEIARQRGERVAGATIAHPVEVLVRSHGPEQQNDFFLADLRDASVDLLEINPMPAQTTAELELGDPDLELLVDHLPPKAAFGVRRLVRHFRERAPDVVSIWQDGACLFAGFAAVIAGVPRIQLVMRGLPPSIRRHMFLPEYEYMYRALAAVPGVEFVSNSRAAAIAYAEWLEIPVDRFSIVYNGVPRMEAQPDADLDAMWQDFEARTAGATHTVGGVFRFDTDKRPIIWIRFAARYARKHPDARFVLVGAGRLMDDAVQLATELGVVDRILFTGRSTNVGYWMKKMDVLVLMSCFEGLPNVLIEAQYLGVPVVSTPAGGASECFIEGVTGHILGCADRTDLDEACEKVHALVGRAQDEAIFGPATRDFLDPHFAVGRMLENFMAVACKRPGA